MFTFPILGVRKLIDRGIADAAANGGFRRSAAVHARAGPVGRSRRTSPGAVPARTGYELSPRRRSRPRTWLEVSFGT